jgi:hypothetical protein
MKKVEMGKEDSEWNWFAEVFFFRCCSPTLLADEFRISNEILVHRKVCSSLDHVAKML